MTSNTNAKARETATAKQRRVWDKIAPSYDKQMSFFERIQFGGGREWVCSRATGDREPPPVCSRPGCREVR